METSEIKAVEFKDLRDVDEFIRREILAIKEAVGDGLAINALSGGVDSSVVTMLGHLAIGDRLKTYFIDTGLMRQNEPEQVVEIFQKIGIGVEIVDAKDVFLRALAGLTDPEEKREKGVTQPFYKNVFKHLIEESGAKVLLHGTILTDVDETAAGIKRQHNVFTQIGIDPEDAFGYKIYEPLVQLRKDGVRMVAKVLSLPNEIVNRQPFPGPGLVTRIKGEVTAEKLEIVRQATVITEELLNPLKPFQTMTILNEERVTGIVDGKRAFGLQIDVRAWESVDARTAVPMDVPYEILMVLGRRIPAEVPGVVSVTYQLSPKPPCTMEAI